MLNNRCKQLRYRAIRAYQWPANAPLNINRPTHHNACVA